MSILNLNAPQGRGPAGKKSLKILMGVGLLAAVLGFGSTFAADILINNNNQSEFGQGVAQTVYCGKDNPTKITVKPMSSFVNSELIPEVTELRSWVPAVGTGKKFVDVSSSINTDVSTGVTYIDTQTGLTITNGRGYWIKSRTDNDYYDDGARTTAPNSYPIFVPQVSVTTTSSFFGRSSSSTRYGFYEYDTWTNGYSRVDRAAAPASTTPSKFELSGVEISNIPASCSGKNFVISAYGETGTAKSFIGDGPLGQQVREITAFWDGLSLGPVRVSGDRNSFDSNELIAGAQTQTKLTIDLLKTEPGRIRLNSQEVYKLVVETQEDAINVR
jgi:hypothetical protein